MAENNKIMIHEDPKILKFKILVEESPNIVFFGGAGVSTESGIPDFRSKDGLYNQKYDYPPEQILSRTFFDRMTEEFYRFYRDKLNSLKYEPNITHFKLAELEKQGKLTAVVTQNIDGLHQKAGSKRVLELHGSVLRNYCMKCGKFHSAREVFGSKAFVYTLIVTATNDPVFRMPETGGSGFGYLPLAMLLCAAPIPIIIKKSNKKGEITA